MKPLYDSIGLEYRNYRRPDPRIAAMIDVALGNAQSIVNVGAGAGSYEPQDRDVTAVELSPTMIAQRPHDAARAVQASAMALPFADKSMDAALALLTVHHWPDQLTGLREMARVARKRCMILTWDGDCAPFWLTRDYFPEILAKDRKTFSLAPFREAFGDIEVRTVPVPHDCSDGFLCAYWRRPEAYFDPGVRLSISSFSKLDATAGLARLRSHLDDETWMRRNGDLMQKTQMDFGYRLVVAEVG
ncbi:MAG TPA: class I SAM-dependent methyltransferase [Rhizomicrobium sp.]|nr:class I SAM-dependent methyltransferase [Rhizomicrobium sp.]